LKKPYIEYKDFVEGDNLVDFAKDTWEIFKKRENSYMIDLFYGQL